MSSPAKVQECTRKVRTATGAEEKLNAIAAAIEEFVNYFELMEHQIKNIETRLRRMEM